MSLQFDPRNSESNQLPAGINQVAFLEAIEMSGYPLQGLVAKTLDPDFGITEEWGFIDRDTRAHRSLDLFAYKRLGSDGRCPALILLVECKRSRHPYIFFKSAVDGPNPRFPTIVGTPRGVVSLRERSGNRSRDVLPATFLELDTLDFAAPGPPRCATFTRAVVEGKKVSLTGTDPFNSLILPLTKALDHASTLYEVANPIDNAYPILILCISVIDAPMLLVDDPAAPKSPALIPWVRIVRQEAQPKESRRNEWYRYYSVDVVHFGFLEQYIANHVLPFADQFAERCLKTSEVLGRGGVVSSLENWNWQKVQARPKAR